VAGKIILKIRQVAEANGINNAHQLQIALSVAPMVARRLWQGKLTKFDLGTMERLCERFNCQPNDLMEYEPEQK
jgi:DNA-binding Xre family transcriptional regulator